MRRIRTPKQNKYAGEKVKKDLKENQEMLQQIFHNTIDIKFRNFQIQNQEQTSAFICYMEGMVSEEFIHFNIMDGLAGTNLKDINIDSPRFISILKNQMVKAPSMKETTILDEILDGILTGQTAIFLNQSDRVLLVTTVSFQSRGVEEPETEATVRGSREGFNEVIQTNTSLIRRKINNSNLIFEELIIGKETKTKVRIAYLNNVANKEVVKEVRNRLKAIKTDVVLETGYLEQYIGDHPYSIFSTVGNSEKPDKVAAKILEGRIAILCDGTPFVLTVPHLFIEVFQVPEDYYSNAYVSSLIRIFRIMALFLTVSTPAVFVAAATFHHEMVPSQLLTTMAAAEERVPFPIFLEAIIMIVIFQLLREAGVRMPRPIGSAVSIVGALVIGEAAVQAGLVGAPMVIVVALTAITGFVVTALSNAVILMRFFLLILAGLFGFYGLLIGTLFLVAHVVSLRSFGVPYLTPLGPIVTKDLRDSIIRLPLKFLQSKSKSITRKRL
ncbi:spore germination protein [Gracilibacillus kekensis]|uniref:Spore germination protein KA n=1 Tax=Gracilibacillus kekensis TaxID=1027249 RepID=A0A1M7QAJ1_9BACI|nr:spore germination protein [Gracilibacillus kekensis]SHN27738.1 spore germination protein KA [Gracilibacillus kekensis]